MSGETKGESGRKPEALFRLLAINGAAGAALGVLFVLGVLALDVASIRTLLIATGDWVIALSLLTMGSVVTFASVAMGGAIMMIPRDENGPGRGQRQRIGDLVPLRAVAGARRLRRPHETTR